MSQPTFDFINNRFFDQRIKVLKVISQQEEQVIAELTILASLLTIGVTINPITGLLNETVTLALAGTPLLRSTSVLPDKVINQGTIPVNVFVNGVLAVATPIELPWQGVLDVPGAVPGDVVQKHDAQVEGFNVSPVTIGGVLNLVLKAAMNMCVIVASERILKVNAAEVFC